MPASRLESNPLAAADSARTASGPEPPAKPANRFALWLPLLATLLLMPLVGYATAAFLIVPQFEKALARPQSNRPAAQAAPAKTVPSRASPAEGPKQTFPLNKMIVNVSGTMGTRYLMTSLTLSGVAEDFKTRIEQNKDQLLDLASGSLSAKTITDLEKPGARNLIRTELLSIFNNALGESLIKEIYFTEFAVQ